jgi:transcriptional regulator with XRE-family HTH domain
MGRPPHPRYPLSGRVLIDPQKLRYWRDYRLFTREELAEDMRVSYWTIVGWELGRRKPRTAQFRRLLVALGVDAGDLMYPATKYESPE